MIWIYTVCKGRVYPGSAGPGLKQFSLKIRLDILCVLSPVKEETSHEKSSPVSEKA